MNLRILALGPQHVFPPVDGGKEGIFGAINALARRSTLTYAFPTSNADLGATAQDYAQNGIRAVAVPFEPNESLGLILGATLNLRPYKFEKYGSSAAAAAFNRAIPHEHFDAIVCHHAHTMHLAERLSERRGWRVPILLREHNIEYELVTSYRRSLGLLGRIAAWPFEALTRREERSIWRRADVVAFLSDHDLKLAREADGQSCFVLSREGIPIPTRRDANHPGVDAPLLVLLNPRATQSVANLRDFIHRYWQVQQPTRQEFDGIELHVTGVTTEQLAVHVHLSAQQLNKLRIRGLGFMPSLAPTLASSLALVSPTFVGGGIRKKVLEAMAHQLPVIATRLDMATCNYFAEGENVLPMDSLDEFARSVTTLRNNAAYWRSLADNARNTVDEYANWERYGDVVIDTLRKLVSTPARKR